MIAHISFFGHVHAEDVAGIVVIALAVLLVILGGKGRNAL